MKKIYFILAAAAAMLLAASCNKEQNAPIENSESQVQKGEVVTIEATLPVDSKVTLTPNASGLALAWAKGDVITVAEHGNLSNSKDFTLVSGDGTQSAKFSGTAISAASYDIIYDSVGGGNCASQTQSSDGDTGHLKYSVTLSGASSYENVAFTEEWAEANSCSIVKSGALHLVAALPKDVAAIIDSVTFVASQDIFNGGNTLAVSIDTPGDAGDDDILDVYATLRTGDVDILAGTELFVKFSTDSTHKVYTRYYVFPSAITLKAGKVNVFNLTCDKIDKSAGKNDQGTLESPYLIADGYQLAALNSYASTTATTYVKLVDDIDMTGIAHTPINEGIDKYTVSVDFDGNNKTISNLGKCLFYVFKGTIKDLTLDQCKVTTRGIFAEYCQGTGHSITNVNITKGSISAGENVGAFIGKINNGSGTVLTMSNCTVSNTTVSGSKGVGGVIGVADQLVSIEDCKFVGGTVTCSGQYVGGFMGSTGIYASTITNCQVEGSTINVNGTEDPRGGGFIGQLQTDVTISGCTVGTSGTKVTVNTKQPKKTSSDPEKYAVINVGGFVGVNYGTITKNGGVRSKAYAKITSANTIGTPLRLGGFVGFGRGTIEYSDAIVDMTGLKGQQIGGFAGYAIQAGTVIDSCTVSGSITGNNYTGGFVGYVDSGAPVISNCTASGTVSGQSGSGGFVGQNMTGVLTNCSTAMTCTFSGSNNGGFAGQIQGGTATGCSSSGDVTATGGTTYGGFVGLITNIGTTLDKCYSTSSLTAKGTYFGGFAGAIDKGTVLIKRCYASGNVTSDNNYAAGFIGNIHHASNTLNATIQNCYSTGNIINSNQIRGGFIAQVGTVTTATISNCYASGEVVGSFRLGGLIGNIGSANVTVDHCAAWNSAVTASSVGAANWSSGAVVGTAFPSCNLTDNYRNPDMALKAFWGNVTGYTFELEDDYQHANVDGSSASTYLVVKDKSTGVEAASTTANLSGGNYPIFPYHGKVEAGKTLSQLASATLGWDDEIWSFGAALPTLK